MPNHTWTIKHQAHCVPRKLSCWLARPVPERPRAHLGARKNDFIGEFFKENEDTIEEILEIMEENGDIIVTIMGI